MFKNQLLVIPRMIIGLTGSLAAGKGVVSDYFIKKGFVYFSLSDKVREIAKANNMDTNNEEGRKKLQDLGNRLREEKGSGYLAELVSKEITSNEYENAIVDGIRNPGEVYVLRRLKDFYLLAVDAPIDLRFERLKSRNRSSDPKTFGEFVKVDNRDQGIDEGNLGQAVRKCMRLADYSIFNNGALDKFEKRVDKLYKEMSARNIMDIKVK